jgi:hypothetical protein
MRRIIIWMVATTLAMIVLATGVLPAYAQFSPDPGPTGWRFLSNKWVYCDNFYDSDHVYWCWDELYGGYWFRVDPHYYP